jgi:serine/threonine-protein kinase
MRAFSDALGATALRLDASSVIKSAAHLLQDATAEKDVAKTPGLSDKAIALAKSRAATLSRRFRNVHPVAQGATFGILGAVVVGLGYFAFLDPETPRDRTSEKRAEVVVDRRKDAQTIAKVDNAPPPRRETNCDSLFLSPGDASGCNNGLKKATETTAPSGASLEELRAAMKDRNRWEAAFILAQKLAEAGDAEAQFHLGTLYLKSSAHQNPDTAYGWFRRAAEQDNADAQVSLALMYRDGLAADKKRNFEEMVRWLQKAASRNNARANYWLGRAYENGAGSLPKSDAKAEEHYLRASLQDMTEATTALEALKRRRGKR